MRLAGGTDSRPTSAQEIVDLREQTVRELNRRLHRIDEGAPRRWRILNPDGRHNLGVGIDASIEIDVDGHAGYYCAGMNKHAVVRVHGNVGVGVAENMMSGRVEVDGHASGAAGATGRGGILIVRGNASSRCGISLKGLDVVVRGSVGHMTGFMAQKGRIVVCGDAGEALGDSLYEADIYVRGGVASLGADCVEKELRAEHLAELGELLETAGFDAKPREFRRYGSARRLYHFHTDHASSY